MWDNLIDCPFHHFQYDVRTGENYFPRNVYPKDYKRLESQVRPLKTYTVEVRDGDVWVDLESAASPQNIVCRAKVASRH
jgi:3-phenylpropionate/trans-cinnamate dioxygenase ferredoxin subunit